MQKCIENKTKHNYFSEPCKKNNDTRKNEVNKKKHKNIDELQFITISCNCFTTIIFLM